MTPHIWTYAIFLLAGLVLGMAASGLHETTRLSDTLGVIAITNRLTGDTRLCVVVEDPRYRLSCR